MMSPQKLISAPPENEADRQPDRQPDQQQEEFLLHAQSLSPLTARLQSSAEAKASSWKP